jgi:hypothetical protein
MYALSEYYTFVHYLKTMNIDSFTTLIRQNNLTAAAKTHASITSLLHKTAHGTIPAPLQKILKSLGPETFETTRLINRNYETPHKYHPITIVKSLFEIAKGNKNRESMAIQLYQMSNPNFTKRFLKAFMEHVTRETY